MQLATGARGPARALLLTAPALLLAAVLAGPWPGGAGRGHALRVVGAAPGDVALADGLAYAGCLLMVPAAASAACLARRRARPLAVTGAAAMAAGWISTVGLLAVDGLLAGLAADTALTRGATVDRVVAEAEARAVLWGEVAAAAARPGTVLQVIVVVATVGTVAGAALLGVALLGARAAGPWAGPALLAAAPLLLVARLTEARPAALAAHVLLLGGLASLAPRVGARRARVRSGAGGAGDLTPATEGVLREPSAHRSAPARREDPTPAPPSGVEVRRRHHRPASGCDAGTTTRREDPTPAPPPGAKMRRRHHRPASAVLRPP